MFEELKAINEQMQVLKKETSEKYKQLFSTLSAKVFEKHPALESFSWTQYSPYFNDGDECVFSVNEVNYVNGIDIDEDQPDEEFVTDWNGLRDDKGNRPKVKNKHYVPELVQAIKDCRELVSLVEEDTMAELFGNHVEVTVTRNGIETEECSHD